MVHVKKCASGRIRRLLDRNEPLSPEIHDKQITRLPGSTHPDMAIKPAPTDEA
jgi:hypothetical protein